MFSTIFLIGVFLLAFRRFAPMTAVTTAAAIPCIMIAGLFAMNFFEPAALMIVHSTVLSTFLSSDADFICFLVLFLGCTAALLKVVASLPDPPTLPDPFEFRCSLFLTITASLMVMSIVLTACDTSPRMQKILGLRPHSGALFGLFAPDVMWLNFVAIVADGSLARSGYVAIQSIPADESSDAKSAGSQVRNLRDRFIEVQVPVATMVTDAEKANPPEAQEKPVKGSQIETKPEQVDHPTGSKVPDAPQPLKTTNGLQ
ncbi:MAG: hypothetical protein WCH39_01140 [Schlesneria sp.]